MITYIGIVVTVLLTLNLVGTLGIGSDKLRRKAAKDVAAELHELQKRDQVTR